MKTKSPIAAANSADMDGTDNAKYWRVTGEISRCHIMKRISAANKDAAIAEAHAYGMSVRECIELKQKQK